jgi:membrane-associated phospholipid phosphatase
MRSNLAAAIAAAIGLAAAIGAGADGHVAPTIRFDPVLDSALLAAGASAAALSEFALGAPGEANPDRTALGALDAAAIFPYDEILTLSSNVATGAAVAWPALFALGSGLEERLSAASICVEALSATFAAKNALKRLVPKARPYAYGNGTMTAEQTEKAAESVPSGHTALAFCSATVFAVLQLRLRPEAEATPWLVAGGYALAAATGALRVLSGNHFPVDALAGAALGGGIGWIAAAFRPSTKGGGAEIGITRGRGVSGPLLRVRIALP